RPARTARPPVDREQHVRRLQRQHEVMARQRDVLRVGAVTVENGGNLAGPAGAPRGTLTELGARLGGDTYLGHGENSSLLRSTAVLRWTSATDRANQALIDASGASKILCVTRGVRVPARSRTG